MSFAETIRGILLKHIHSVNSFVDKSGKNHFNLAVEEIDNAIQQMCKPPDTVEQGCGCCRRANLLGCTCHPCDCKCHPQDSQPKGCECGGSYIHPCAKCLKPIHQCTNCTSTAPCVDPEQTEPKGCEEWEDEKEYSKHFAAWNGCKPKKRTDEQEAWSNSNNEQLSAKLYALEAIIERNNAEEREFKRDLLKCLDSFRILVAAGLDVSFDEIEGKADAIRKRFLDQEG